MQQMPGLQKTQLSRKASDQTGKPQRSSFNPINLCGLYPKNSILTQRTACHTCHHLTSVTTCTDIRIPCAFIAKATCCQSIHGLLTTPTLKRQFSHWLIGWTTKI